MAEGKYFWRRETMTFLYCQVNMVTTYFTDVEYEAERLSEQLKAIKKILYQSPDQKGGTADSQCYAKIPLSVKIGL